MQLQITNSSNPQKGDRTNLVAVGIAERDRRDSSMEEEEEEEEL